MRAYGKFARYYDTLMQDADYGSRSRYIAELFKKHRSSPALVLDLACGTGSMSLELANMGYEIIGADCSEEMLSVARRKFDKAGKGVLLVCQDMCCLDLYGTVDAAVCCMDSVNHLTNVKKVETAFRKVALFLNPGGVFIFDVNTPYKFKNILGDNSFVYDYDGLFCAWQNFFNAKTGLCRFDLTFFEEKNGAYLRSDESFYEKSYSDKILLRCIKNAGLVPEASYSELTFESPHDNCERIFYVARKPADWSLK